MNDYVSVLFERCTPPLIPRFTFFEKEFHFFRDNRERGSNDTLIQNTGISVFDYLVSVPFEEKTSTTYIFPVVHRQQTKIWNRSERYT